MSQIVWVMSHTWVRRRTHVSRANWASQWDMSAWHQPLLICDTHWVRCLTHLCECELGISRETWVRDISPYSYATLTECDASLTWVSVNWASHVRHECDVSHVWIGHLTQRVRVSHVRIGHLTQVSEASHSCLGTRLLSLGHEYDVSLIWVSCLTHMSDASHSCLMTCIASHLGHACDVSLMTHHICHVTHHICHVTHDICNESWDHICDESWVMSLMS